MKLQDCDRRIESYEFSVVDVETTGLFPEANDRIIEIAILRVDFSGKLVDQYTTLVNPHRDLGPTHIHHVSAKDVKDAPSFEEIAGDILLRLGGAVFTGFNAHFDLRFLRSEIRRLGHEIPSAEPLCVMRLAGNVAPDLPGRKLEVCCKHFGVPLVAAHSAYSDAFATAKLLHECLIRAERYWPNLLKSLEVEPLPEKHRFWPTIPISGKSLSRADAAGAAKAEPTYIEKLVASLPSMASVHPRLDEYLALLDRVLEDRFVTADEAAVLFSQAQELGFSQELARKAHRQYIGGLITVALADGTITEREEQDLREVSRLLSIPEGELDELLLEARAKPHCGVGGTERSGIPKGEFPGLRVCFTGMLVSRVRGQPVSREYAQTLAKERGMIVKDRVSKDLDILVAADPSSLSGKAKKARQYGIRIVAEPAFWRMMGIDVE